MQVSHSLSRVLVLLLCCYTARCFLSPPPGQIRCKSRDKNIPIRFICDGDNDCGDNSDEDEALCLVWDTWGCSRGFIRCNRTCISIRAYCHQLYPGTVNGCSLDSRICPMLRAKKLQSFNEIEELPDPVVHHTDPHDIDPNDIEVYEDIFNQTIRLEDCPQFYTKIGNECISLFTIGNVTWSESRAFCKHIGGDLLIIKPDFSNFFPLLKHLTVNNITKDFWIGGIYTEEMGWQWINGTAMPLHTPMWALRYKRSCSPRVVTSRVLDTSSFANDGSCYNYVQAPDEHVHGNCASITYGNFYYVSDENCKTRKSPLCVARSLEVNS